VSIRAYTTSQETVIFTITALKASNFVKKQIFLRFLYTHCTFTCINICVFFFFFFFTNLFAKNITSVYFVILKMVGRKIKSSEMLGPFFWFPSTSFLNKSIFKSVEGRSTFFRNVVTCLQNHKGVTTQKAVVCSVASTNVSFNLLKLPLHNFGATYITPDQYYSSWYWNLPSCSNPHIRLQQGVKTTAWRPPTKCHPYLSCKSFTASTSHSYYHASVFFRYIWRSVNWYIFRCFRDCFHAEFTISASFYNVKKLYGILKVCSFCSYLQFVAISRQYKYHNKI